MAKKSDIAVKQRSGNGRLANFSSERLMRLLTALGQDVEIVVKTQRRGQERGRIRVVEEMARAIADWHYGIARGYQF